MQSIYNHGDNTRSYNNTADENEKCKICSTNKDNKKRATLVDTVHAQTAVTGNCMTVTS